MSFFLSITHVKYMLIPFPWTSAPKQTQKNAAICIFCRETLPCVPGEWGCGWQVEMGPFPSLKTLWARTASVGWCSDNLSSSTVIGVFRFLPLLKRIFIMYIFLENFHFTEVFANSRIVSHGILSHFKKSLFFLAIIFSLLSLCVFVFVFDFYLFLYFIEI